MTERVGLYSLIFRQRKIWEAEKAHLLNSMVYKETITIARKPHKEGYYTMQDVSNDNDTHF